MTEPSDNPSQLDYRNPMHERTERPASARKVVGWSVGAILLVLFLISIFLPGEGYRPRETAYRIMCASHLRQIGQAMLLYANDNYGRYPPDLAVILATQDITSEVFVCPSHDHDRAGGATTQQVIATMLAGDHLSYVYVGGSNISSQTPDIVVAFDLEAHVPKDAEKNTGINVLLGDGSAVFVDEKIGRAIWARFIAGVRPIKLSECDPTAAPTTGPAGR